MRTQTGKPMNADTKKAWIYANEILKIRFQRDGDKLFVQVGEQDIEIAKSQIKKYAAEYDKTFDEFEQHLHEGWNHF